MKVILVNGSPREKGCTYTALAEVAGVMRGGGIETEFFHIGAKPLSGCLACGFCVNNGMCAVNDIVNDFLDEARDADGFVFGSPVHFAGMSGIIKPFMDRLFYVAMRQGILTGKPAAAVVSCRRGGSTAALDQLNKYFAIAGMPVVSSQYWNMVHGNTPGEVAQDAEGMQIMRTLGNNMAWLLKCIEAGKAAGITLPAPEKKLRTNFIR